MSEPADVFELLDGVAECLVEGDWDRLETIASQPLAPADGLAEPQIEATLQAVQEMHIQLQERMDAIAAELGSVPTIRKAARAYLRF